MVKYDSDKLVRMWKEGFSVPQISKELGVPTTTVNAYINRHRDVCKHRGRSYDGK